MRIVMNIRSTQTEERLLTCVAGENIELKEGKRYENARRKLTLKGVIFKPEDSIYLSLTELGCVVYPSNSC